MGSGSSVQARMSASTFSFSMYLFASAIIFSLSLGITMPFSKLGYISFPNRDIIFSLLKGYNKSAVEKYLKFYENKERYFECKGTAKNSGKKQFRFQMRLDQRRQHSSRA